MANVKFRFETLRGGRHRLEPGAMRKRTLSVVASIDRNTRQMTLLKLVTLITQRSPPLSCTSPINKNLDMKSSRCPFIQQAVLR